MAKSPTANHKTSITTCHVHWFGKYGTSEKKYKPEWSDLDTRPLPAWYDEAKIGIFLHWGVYSVPGFKSEWFWKYWKEGDEDIEQFMKRNYPPYFTYQNFAHQFTAEFFDPLDWARLFASSGAKYVVLTSKHHEGYTLFPSRQSFGWNSMDVGPARDLVADLAAAVRSARLKFGIYHSLFEWFNPLYLQDKANDFETQNYTLTKSYPDLMQLVKDYSPSVIWSDGDAEAEDEYWKSEEFLAWLYNESPVRDEVVVNDRWGNGTACKHGDFYNCADRYNPGTLQKHKWENAFTLDKKSWGYRRNIRLEDIMSVDEMLKEVVSTVSCGGNVLINVGPTKEGTIIPIFRSRLATLGSWLHINGAAVYGSSPWRHQNDSRCPHVWYTADRPAPADPRHVYALVLRWPEDSLLTIADINDFLWNNITLLGNDNLHLKTEVVNGALQVHFPNKEKVKSQHAWTLRFTQTNKWFHVNL